MYFEGGSVEQLLGLLCAVLLKKILFYLSSHVFMFLMEVDLLPCGCLAADVQQTHFKC